LTSSEITRVVNRYIGVEGGYLGLPERFSYRTHSEFYAEYCDLAVSLEGYQGTTRETFIEVLSSLPSRDQAKVLRGVLERFPLGEGPTTREREHVEVQSLIERLEADSGVVGETPSITSEVVLRALADAENLIQSSGPTSAVDRLHTVLHGYLLAVCAEADITCTREDSMVALLRKVQREHPMFEDLGPRSQDISKILNASASILDALLPVRNQASVAHPNETLLAEPEARLVINTSRTLLQYLDAKIS
jgi:hypothetical protein